MVAKSKGNKKAQNAASRKDTFYKRAKEQGYRARSAFKLVHLNNLHGFLKKAKVCLDLCAAPGSWMQVAREFMPAGAVIVGVDLDNIRRIPNTLSIRGDITTDTLRAELRNTLKGYRADIVLHDGSPNVGRNWTQDAYDQNLLVLHAFKIACEFLRYGGDFVTKVFRSKDSPCLEFVFKALFKSVESTKPQASRFESAEIFYVCRSYKLRPEDKADPKFFDPKEVFKEVEVTQASKINLHKPEKINKKSLGYEDGVEILYQESTVTDFIESDRYEELLQQTSAVVFDDDRWSQHPSTSQEIIECCKDIKVLGRKELRMLLTWRRGLRAELNAEKKIIGEEERKNAEAETAKTPEEEEQLEMDSVQQQIEELEARAAKDDKKQQKVVRKQRRELQQKLKMLSMSSGGSCSIQDNHEFFSIKQMEKISDEQLLMDQYDASDSEGEQQPQPKHVRFKKGDYELNEDGVSYRRVGDVTDSESEDDLAEVGEGLFKKKHKRRKKTQDGIEIVPREDMAKKHRKAIKFANGEVDSSDDSSSDSDDDEDEGVATKEKNSDKNMQKKVRFADDSSDSGESDSEHSRDGNISDSGMGDDDYDDDAHGGLTTDLVGDITEDKKIRTAESWFSQHDMDDMVGSDDELDLEADEAVGMFKKIGGKVYGEEQQDEKDEQQTEINDDNNKENDDTHPDDAAAEKSKLDDKAAPTTGDIDRLKLKEELSTLKSLRAWITANKDAFPSKVVIPSSSKTARPATAIPDINTVNMDDWGMDVIKLCKERRAPKRLADLDATGLALATQLIKTKKAKRDITLQGWNRYMKGDEEGLPQWFVDDEEQHLTPAIDVDESEVRYYNARDKAINTRTLKKVMEAKVRKQRRFKKTMQNVMKKAEAMQGSSLLSDYDKQQEIKTLYQKAMKTRQKKDTSYVVMTTKNKGQRPMGIKGRYKLVDARLKKDVRAKLKADKRKKTVGRGKKSRR